MSHFIQLKIQVLTVVKNCIIAHGRIIVMGYFYFSVFVDCIKLHRYVAICNQNAVSIMVLTQFVDRISVFYHHLSRNAFQLTSYSFQTGTE